MNCCTAPLSDRLVLSIVPLSIGAFLDISDLATCEKAQLFSPYIFEWLWDVTGSKLLGNTPLWNITAKQFLYKDLHGKELISQIHSLRRAVLPSKWLSPWVVKTSFCSVKATPSCTPHPGDLQEDPNEDSIETDSTKPDRTGVAIVVGTYTGQPLIIGMKVAASGLVDDSLCVGIEAAGHIDSGRMMSISFAPFSGKCFVEHENGLTIQTKALPRIRDFSEGRVWIHVTEKGGIRFLRQFQDGNLEDTGLLPPEMLPDWIQSYFGCIDVWLSDLACPVDVSVEYSGCRFPTAMPIFNKHGTEIKTTWSVLGD